MRRVAALLLTSLLALPALADEAAPTTAPGTDPTPAPAPASGTDPTPAPAPTRDWHVGLNVRTDLGTHPIRLDGGVRIPGWDFILVLDPMFWTDGQVDTDALVAWRGDGKWSLIGGWRLSTIGLQGGTQLQEKLVLGAGSDLPPLFGGAVRATWGFELAAMVLKHGGGLPAETIGFKSGRFYIDLLNFGMWVRFEFARGF
jgi:hypothetical protein